MTKEILFIDTSLDGVSLAFQAALRDFKIVYSSPNEYVLSIIRKGKAPGVPRKTQLELISEERISTAADVQKAVGSHDIIVVTRDAHSLEGDSRTELNSLCKLVGSAVRRDSLIIYSGVCLPGTVESVVMENLEKASGLQVGVDLDLAYVSAARGVNFVAEKSRLRGRAMGLASELWGEGNIVELGGIREAEAASILNLMEDEALKAVAYEALLLFEQLDVEVRNVFERVREHVVPSAVRDPKAAGVIRYLTQGEGMFFRGTRFLHQVDRTIDAGSSYGIARLKDFIKDKSRDKRGKVKVFLAADTEDERRRILGGVGSRRCLTDSYLTADLVDKLQGDERMDLSERMSKADAVVLFTKHSELREFALEKTGDKKVLFDFSMLQALPRR